MVTEAKIFNKCRRKTVVVSLWNELATSTGQELLDNVDKSPVIAIKSLRVGDFQGSLTCYNSCSLGSKRNASF